MNSVTCIDMANGKTFTKEFDDLIKQKTIHAKMQILKKTIYNRLYLRWAR